MERNFDHLAHMHSSNHRQLSSLVVWQWMWMHISRVHIRLPMRWTTTCILTPAQKWYFSQDYMTLYWILFFSVRDINNSLTLMSSGFHLSEDRPFILCDQVANFAFANVTRVTISGIDLVNCSEYRIEFVPKFEVENSGFFNIENIQGTALKLITTTVSITNSSFFYFTGSSNHEGSFIGGAMILTQSNVSIQNCQFEGNLVEPYLLTREATLSSLTECFLTITLLVQMLISYVAVVYCT